MTITHIKKAEERLPITRSDELVEYFTKPDDETSGLRFARAVGLLWAMMTDEMRLASLEMAKRIVEEK
jgi:hypothetical protein